MIFAAIFAILIGLGMIGQWSASYLTRQIPELATEPIRIVFHIAAEMITAISLILGGIGLLTHSAWGQPLYLIALGMLFYTAVVSPGYFAQKGQWGWLGMFAAIIILGLISLTLLF